MFFVYVLQCGDDKLYIGQTANLKERMRRHQRSPSRQMKGRLPIRLVGFQEVATRAGAIMLEASLKKLKRRDLVLKRINGGLSSAG